MFELYEDLNYNNHCLHAYKHASTFICRLVKVDGISA